MSDLEQFKKVVTEAGAEAARIEPRASGCSKRQKSCSQTSHKFEHGREPAKGLKPDAAARPPSGFDCAAGDVCRVRWAIREDFTGNTVTYKYDGKTSTGTTSNSGVVVLLHERARSKLSNAAAALT
jgi:hypothetical protein